MFILDFFVTFSYCFKYMYTSRNWIFIGNDNNSNDDDGDDDDDHYGNRSRVGKQWQGPSFHTCNFNGRDDVTQMAKCIVLVVRVVSHKINIEVRYVTKMSTSTYTPPPNRFLPFTGKCKQIKSYVNLIFNC